MNHLNPRVFLSTSSLVCLVESLQFRQCKFSKKAEVYVLVNESKHSKPGDSTDASAALRKTTSKPRSLDVERLKRKVQRSEAAELTKELKSKQSQNLLGTLSGLLKPRRLNIQEGIDHKSCDMW